MKCFINGTGLDWSSVPNGQLWARITTWLEFHAYWAPRHIWLGFAPPGTHNPPIYEEEKIARQPQHNFFGLVSNIYIYEINIYFYIYLKSNPEVSLPNKSILLPQVTIDNFKLSKTT